MKRGHHAYSFMYSVFGFSSLTGGLIILIFFDMIDYSGFLILCFIVTLVSAYLLYIFEEEKKFDYVNAMGGEEEVRKL